MNYGVVYGMGWVWGIFQPNRPLKIEKSPTLGSYKNNVMYHHAPLVRWSLHKYKCLWTVGGKGRGSSLQEGVSHIYIYIYT